MLLYTYEGNFRAHKALIAAQFSGANVKIAPNFVFGETNKTEAFLKKFPLGKVSVSFIMKPLASFLIYDYPCKSIEYQFEVMSFCVHPQF